MGRINLKLNFLLHQSYNEYLKFGKSAPKKFQIVKTDVVLNGNESPLSRYAQNIAEDAIVVYD
jgi:hypothetical protein